MLAVALVLLLASGAFSWWGTQLDTSRFSYRSIRGLEIGPFVAEDWEIFYFPSSIFRPYVIRMWWDFAALHPEYTGYGSLAAIWMSLWLTVLGLVVVALFARAVPRSRMRGIPTFLQAFAGLALIAMILIASLIIPGTLGVPSFSGVDGKLAWGPRLGLFFALAAAGLIAVTSILGYVVDRALRGTCWKCYRAAIGRTCGYCEARL